ncbi:PI-actitoxin-Axm2b-like [Amblyomma americanum]
MTAALTPRRIMGLLLMFFASAGAAPASSEWRLRAALGARDPDSCALEPERGLCYAAFTLYYFDAATGTCEEFLYGGCGGNDNRFGSLAECLATCASSATKTTSAARDS